MRHIKMNGSRLLKTLVLLVALAVPANAGEFKQWIKTQEATHYQQTGLCLEDPKGDAFLIRKLDQVPQKPLEALVKSTRRQRSKKKKNSRLSKKQRRARPVIRIGRTVPIDVDRLVNKCREIILRC